MEKPGVSRTLQAAYDEQYSDSITDWRELCAKYKAENILAVCGKMKFARVLDCGAGEGSILGFLDRSAAFSELYAAEISDSGIRQIEKRKLGRLREVRKFDGYQLPWPDKHFDLAYCSHVLEHVEHPRLLLREVKRLSGFQVFEIPLDYSIGVDGKLDLFLSYGHINIFTPSLFKFLLRSEGFEILEERYSHAADEVIRFSWYRNEGLRPTFRREAYLRLLPLLRLFRRVTRGKAADREFGFSAYTCLARGVGELKAF
jgi:ubiquinone/menaquinone biosynthesis C-methylase UbiE